MGKNRFPLKLAEDTRVRNLDELREHFDLESVLGHYKSGKLLTWLEDRYLEGEAEAVRALDAAAPDFQRKLCEVFQVEYTGNDVDLEEIERRQERLKRLRTIADDTEYIKNIDRVAFDQEELADLLDEGESRIYLCGGKFSVPASRKGITYIGIGNPAVHISGKAPENPEELGIQFTGVQCDQLSHSAASDVEKVEKRHSSDFSAVPFEELRRFVLMPHSEHYYLHYEMEFDDQAGEEVQVWYRHELPSGKKSALSQDVLSALRDEDGDWYSNDSSDWDYISCGEELCIRNHREETWSLLNLQGSCVKYTQDQFNGKWLAAFDSKYIVFYDEEDRSIEIFSRGEPERSRVLQAKDDYRLCLNNTVIGRNVGNLSGQCGLLNESLYFIVEQSKEWTSWLACFDLNTDLFHFVAALGQEPYDAKIIGNAEYAYIIDSFGSDISASTSAINLHTRTSCVLGELIKGWQTDCAVLSAADTDSLCAIELSSCNRRGKGYLFEKLYDLEGLADADMFSYGSNVYIYSSDESAEAGKRIGYRLDLAKETIQPERFLF